MARRHAGYPRPDMSKIPFRDEHRDRRHLLWPAALGVAGLGWYAADSLRHRRESGDGYDLRGDVDVSEERFLFAAEALTGAPIARGNDVDLLINGDPIFPAPLDAIRGAPGTRNPL